MGKSKSSNISDNKPPEEFSKSKLKRESEALQVLGKLLIDLPETQLAQIPLPDTLRDSIMLARSLKTHESIRRQSQYIGKVMRTVDPEPIKLALKKIQFSHEKSTTHFHKIEQWRDQLIQEGDAGLQKLFELYPDCDRQQIRQLIRNAQHDRTVNKNSGAETELFRYLRELMQTI
jgi:ribosome-associated protein